MQIRPFFILFMFLMGCGKDVNLSTARLEQQSSVTIADAAQAYTSGSLVRGEIDKIIVNSRTLTVSKYSSHLAQEFISSRPEGSTINVKFKGEVQGKEIVISKIEAI